MQDSVLAKLVAQERSLNTELQSILQALGESQLQQDMRAITVAAQQLGHGLAAQVSSVCQYVQQISASIKGIVKGRPAEDNIAESAAGLALSVHEYLQAVRDTHEKRAALLATEERDATCELEKHLSTFRGSDWQETDLSTRRATSSFANVLASADVAPSADGGSSTTVSASSNADAVCSSVPAAVTAFDVHLAKHGGANGGWQHDDHKQFVQILTACRGDYHKCVRAASEAMVWLNPDDIAAHAAWHRQYATLLDAKRQAVAQWREERQQAAPAAAPVRNTSGGSSTSRQAAREAALKAREDAQAKRQAVARWRAAEVEKARLLQQVRQTADRQRLEEQRKERERKAQEVKTAVVQHKHRKEQQRREAKELAEAAAHAAAAAAAASIDSEAIARRNAELVEKKSALLQAKQVEKENQTARMMKLVQKAQQAVAPTVQRDATRLIKPTAAALQRELAPREHGAGPLGPTRLLQQGGRAMPSWRKGI